MNQNVRGSFVPAKYLKELERKAKIGDSLEKIMEKHGNIELYMIQRNGVDEYTCKIETTFGEVQGKRNDWKELLRKMQGIKR